MKLFFVNIFPNIYLFYFQTLKENNHKVNKPFILNKLSEFIKKNNIDKIIKINEETSFWFRNEQYINQIESQLESIESDKLFEYYNLKIKELKNDYYSNKKVLIISTNNIDISIGLFILFFKIKCNMNYKKALESIQSKLHSKIFLSNKMKLFIKNKLC